MSVSHNRRKSFVSEFTELLNGKNSMLLNSIFAFRDKIFDLNNAQMIALIYFVARSCDRHHLSFFCVY